MTKPITQAVAVPTLSPDIQRRITELRATRPYDGRRVTLRESRGGWKYAGVSGICTHFAADRHYMVIVVEHDPNGYWPIGMEILAELDHASVPVFNEREGSLRWISWEQHGDAEHAPDCRPVKWPPPAEVLAFWETGFGGGDGEDAYCTVVALVRAESSYAAIKVIQDAWSPGIGEWRFNREYGNSIPPGDRFPPPKWSIEMKRWPWRKDA